jgi:hypothetical protein
LSINSFQSGVRGFHGFDERPRAPRFDPRVGAMIRWLDIVGLIGDLPIYFIFREAMKTFVVETRKMTEYF